jgi:hypothetical protein
VADAPPLTREQRLENACRAVLLFFQVAYWDDSDREHWKRLTGSTEATTRVLGDIVRAALRGGPS